MRSLARWLLLVALSAARQRAAVRSTQSPARSPLVLAETCARWTLQLTRVNLAVPMNTISDALKAAFPLELIEPIPEDHWTSGGQWATPCMCGHDSHGYSHHCEHMCCDTGDCECGGFEPQPGMYLPTVRREGLHPFLQFLRSR